MFDTSFCAILSSLSVSLSLSQFVSVALFFFMVSLQRLPPLSTDPERCQRAFVGNTIGQANGVYDKAIDLRFCDFTNEKSNLKGKSLAAALMSGAKFDGADMTEVVMSKAYAVGASFRGNYVSLVYFFLGNCPMIDNFVHACNLCLHYYNILNIFWYFRTICGYVCI